LLDLDVHFGTGALSLDLEPGRGLTDAIENPGRIDGLFIERAMVRANDRLCVLSAEAPINQPMLTDGSAYFQLQEEMRHAFEGTVIDFPRSMLVQFPHLLNDVHVVVLTVELTLAATRDTIRILSWLKANAPQARVIIAANKVVSNAQEVSRKDFEGSIERKVDVVLPVRREERRHRRQARPAAGQAREELEARPGAEPAAQADAGAGRGRRDAEEKAGETSRCSASSAASPRSARRRNPPRSPWPSDGTGGRPRARPGWS
jgi:pilus assembly protein CpaE